MRKRLVEIEVARFFALIAVLFVHFTSQGIASSSEQSIYFYIYTALNSIGRLGVPVFFLLSGLVLFYSYYKKPFTVETMMDFYKKRIKFIIVPYVMICLLYYTFSVVLNAYVAGTSIQFSVGTLLQEITLTGGSFMHLYFLYVLIQFYLIFPIIMFVFKKVTTNVWFVIIGALAVQFGWFFVNKNFLQVENRSIIFLTYFAFFVIGGILGVHYNRIMAEMKQWSRLLLVGLFAVSAAVMVYYDILLQTYNRTGMYADIFKIAYGFEMFWTALGLFAALGLVAIGQWFVQWDMTKLNNFFVFVSSISFGIYLIHPLFLSLWDVYFMLKQPNIHLWVLMMVPTVTILSVIFSYVVGKWKYGWILIGK